MSNFKNLTYAVASLLLTVGDANAKQTKEVTDGCEIEVEIASNDLTRIKLIDDRISSVRMNQGELELQEDSKVGDIYIKPTTKKKSSINIFITSEKGKTYGLMLKPLMNKAEQIILTDVITVNQKSYHKVSEYEGEIIRIMKLLRDWNFKEELTNNAFSDDERFVLKARIKNNGYIGEIIEYINHSNIDNFIDPISLLNEKSGDWLALRVDRKQIPPNESALLYVIRGGTSE